MQGVQYHFNVVVLSFTHKPTRKKTKKMKELKSGLSF